jgi:hypothetical protein
MLNVVLNKLITIKVNEIRFRSEDRESKRGPFSCLFTGLLGIIRMERSVTLPWMIRQSPNTTYVEKIEINENYIYKQFIADKVCNMSAGIQIIILKCPIQPRK